MLGHRPTPEAELSEDEQPYNQNVAPAYRQFWPSTAEPPLNLSVISQTHAHIVPLTPQQKARLDVLIIQVPRNCDAKPAAALGRINLNYLNRFHPPYAGAAGSVNSASASTEPTRPLPSRQSLPGFPLPRKLHPDYPIASSNRDSPTPRHSI